MNRVELVGRLTSKPELRYTSSNIAYTRFSVAISRVVANAQGERGTDFINVVVWRNAAENCHKFLRKGSKAAVVGNLQSRSYDAQDGTKRYVTEVVAEEVEFIGSRASDGEQVDAGNQGNADNQGGTTKLTPIQDDQLPF